MQQHYYSQTTYFQYTKFKWLQEVSKQVAHTLHFVRPFRKDDIIVGCAPGTILENIFYVKQNSMQVSCTEVEIEVCSTSRLCDISKEFTKLSTKLSNVRYPLPRIFCEQSTNVVSSFFEWLPPQIDCIYLGFIIENLTEEQIISLNCCFVEKLAVDGVLAWFASSTTSICYWESIVAKLEQLYESPNGEHEKFLKNEKCRIEFQIGSFKLDNSIEQDSRIYYLLIQKKDAAP